MIISTILNDVEIDVQAEKSEDAGRWASYNLGTDVGNKILNKPDDLLQRLNITTVHLSKWIISCKNGCKQ